MVHNDTKLKKEKRKKFEKRLNKISFDEETIPKDDAINVITTNLDNILSEPTPLLINTSPKQPAVNVIKPDHLKKLKQKKKPKHQPDEIQLRPSKDGNESLETQLENQTEINNSQTLQKSESKRAKKRKKHEQLILEKRVKVDLVVRDKCLNYLSRWKHSRSDWKFEKLRQVWLQQNMFDSNKVPNEFWKTLLEYLAGARGNIKQTIIESALKIIEEIDKESEESVSEDKSDNNSTRLQRARDIVQHLQE